MNKPNLFCDFVPQALTAAHNVTPEEVRQKRTGMDAVIAHLRPLQQAQTRVLEAQLGRQFSKCKTLWDTPS